MDANPKYQKVYYALLLFFTLSLGFYAGVGFGIKHLEEKNLSQDFIIDTIYSYVNVGNLRSAAINFLKKKEGYCDKPTISCDGSLTIGYGHLIKEKEQFSYLSKEEATRLLEQDLDKALEFVKKETKLSGNKALALGMLAFNLGGGRFLKYLKEDSLLVSNNIERIRRYCHYKRLSKDGQYLTIKSKALLERREFELFIFRCYDF